MIYLGIIIIICYLIIILWFASGIINNPKTLDKMFSPNVSIIISAYNEENNIKNLLEALISQTYKSNYEIIIANDRSNDSTEKIILNYSEKYKFIKLINILETPIGWGNKK